MDFTLSKQQAMVQKMYKEFAENEVKPLAKKVDAEEYFPKEIRNYCFEADITNDELTFSYKLREGIAQNMNACFLMKKMGITV